MAIITVTAATWNEYRQSSRAQQCFCPIRCVDNGHGEKVLGSRIEDIWSSDNGTTVDMKIAATMKTIFKEIDSLVNSGVRAYNELESTTRQLNQSKELAETRSREVKRLHDQDEQSRSTLAVRNVHFVIAFFPEEIMPTSPVLYHIFPQESTSCRWVFKAGGTWLVSVCTGGGPS